MTSKKRSPFVTGATRCARIAVPCALALIAGLHGLSPVYAGGGGGGGGNQMRARSIEIVRGAFSSAPSTSIQTLAAPARDNDMPQAEHLHAAPEQQPLDARTLRHGEAMARRLVAESESAFSRGLMSVSDYAEHLETAAQLRFRLAERQRDKQLHATAMAEQQQLWQRAVERLKRFDQPASQGWAADVAYAELQLANSNLAVARIHGDAVGAANALSMVRDLGHKQFALRMDDYKVGLATLPQISEAASQIIEHVSLAPQTAAQRKQSLQAMDGYRSLLEDVVHRTDAHAGRRGGLGRADRLEFAQAELAHAKAVAAELRGDKAAAKSALEEADLLADRAFHHQLKFHAMRTASLYDLARSWQKRGLVQAGLERHDTQDRAKAGPPHAAGEEVQASPRALSQQANLNRLLHCAQATRDLRGRNAADVTLVHSLHYLRQL